MFNDKSILITGGTGSFGKEFIKAILDQYNPRRVIVFSRDELKQYEMQQTFDAPAIKALKQNYKQQFTLHTHITLGSEN